jgi:hypothetical protein
MEIGAAAAHHKTAVCWTLPGGVNVSGSDSTKFGSPLFTCLWPELKKFKEISWIDVQRV